MKKIYWMIMLVAHFSFGIEVSRDSIESSWSGGDSIWFRNKSALPIRINGIYLKRITGSFGDGLVFKVSNEKGLVLGAYSHWFSLRHSGDSLYIPIESWNQNPVITIPAFDSIYIKTILYGTCLFCVSSSPPPIDYHLELYFVVDKNNRAKINVYGNFITGAVHKSNARKSKTELDRTWLINGRKSVNQIKTKANLLYPQRDPY
jgi:hypothetical protein